MKHEVRIELTRQLEKIRLANEGANSWLLFILATLAEIMGAVAFFIFAVRVGAEDGLYWVAYLIFFLGMIPVGHAAYLSFNRFANRKLRLLYEAVLDVPQSTEV